MERAPGREHRGVRARLRDLLVGREPAARRGRRDPPRPRTRGPDGAGPLERVAAASRPAPGGPARVRRDGVPGDRARPIELRPRRGRRSDRAREPRAGDRRQVRRPGSRRVRAGDAGRRDGLLGRGRAWSRSGGRRHAGGGRRRAHAVRSRLDLLHHDHRVPFGRGLPARRRVDGRGDGMVRTSVDHRVPRRVSRAARRDHAPARQVLRGRGRGAPGADRTDGVRKAPAGRCRIERDRRGPIAARRPGRRRGGVPGGASARLRTAPRPRARAPRARTNRRGSSVDRDRPGRRRRPDRSCAAPRREGRDRPRRARRDRGARGGRRAGRRSRRAWTPRCCTRCRTRPTAPR